MSMVTILSTLFAIVFLLFPLWVAIHGWRKDHQTLAIIIGISYLVPLLPQLIAIVAVFIIKPYQPNWDFSPNPNVYVGCGTIFYGATKRDSDGSFITTQWFVLLYLPVIPIQSYRVIYLGSDTSFQGAIITSTTNYSIIENLRINVKQVIQAYTLIVSFVIIAASIFVFLNNIQGSTGIDTGKMSEMGTSSVIGLLIVYVIVGYRLFRAK